MTCVHKLTMPMTSHDTPPITKTGEKCGKTKHLTISFDGREETVVSKPLEPFNGNRETSARQDGAQMGFSQHMDLYHLELSLQQLQIQC